jgi:peroxiredoxin
MPPAGISFAVPLDGPATVECGAFVEFPDERVRIGRSWEVIEDGRPIRIWKLTGLDTINGSRCLVLEGSQESEDWQHPRADHTAWRRQDKLWVLPDSGVPVKVERVLEKREPAHQRPTQRSYVQYELQDNMEYRNQLFEDRRHEILQAHKFDEALRPLTKNLSRAGIQPLDRIISRAAFHLQSQPRTPYRDSILQVKRNAEAARRGEPPPTLRMEEPPTPIELQVGGRAPDFVATDVLTSEPARLRKWLGHTVVMIFYSPQSGSAEDVLHLGRSLQETYHHRVSVLGFAVSDDYEKIRRQYQSLQLRFPVLSGKGLRQSYLVEATPKFVIIDAGGIVRGIFDGWGPEIPEVVRDDLRKCVQADDNFTGGNRATKPGNAQFPMSNDQRMPKPE